MATDEVFGSADAVGTDWEFDKSGTLVSYLKMAKDILEPSQEVFQNAIDSSIPTTDEIRVQNINKQQAFEIPNRIVIRTKFPVGSNILLTVKDNGRRGITKDYEGDIKKFLAALKADSKKVDNPYTCGHFGIGMTLLFLLSDKIDIVSQDDYAGLINAFTMYLTEDSKGRPRAKYSEPHTKGISQQWQKVFDIYHAGTKLIFYKDKRKWKGLPRFSFRDFTAENIIGRIKHIYGLRLSWLKNTTVVLDNEIMDMTPDYMKGHPEKHLATTNLDGKILNISGNIYRDPHGRSELWVIGRGGQLIDKIQFKRKTVHRCTGYVYCEEWEPTSDRKGVMCDEIWDATLQHIIDIVEMFPEEEQNNNSLNNSLEKWKDALYDKLDRLYNARKDLRKLKFFTEPEPGHFTADENGTDILEGKNKSKGGKTKNTTPKHDTCPDGYRWNSKKGKCVKIKKPRRNIITGRIEPSYNEGKERIDFILDRIGLQKPLVHLNEVQSAYIINLDYPNACAKIVNATTDFRDSMISWAIASAYPEQDFGAFYSELLNY